MDVGGGMKKQFQPLRVFKTLRGFDWIEE